MDPWAIGGQQYCLGGQGEGINRDLPLGARSGMNSPHNQLGIDSMRLL